MYLGRHRRRMAGVAALAAAAVLAVGCSSSSAPPSSGGGTKVTGGTATFAEEPGALPNWIWPFAPITNYSVYSSQYFQWLMYRPLYMFGGNNSSITVNYPLSPANAPVYSNGGKTVVITMKGWKWSNGETVDATDVVFWLNMMKAEKANYAGYAPGRMPDNLTSFSATGPNQVTLQLNKAYSSIWFTYNQLAEITPDAGGLGRHQPRRQARQRRLRHRQRQRQLRQVQGGLHLPDRPGQGRQHVRDQPDLGRRRTGRGSCPPSTPTAM